MDKQDLYDGIVHLCQSYGFMTDHSYDKIEELIESLVNEEDGPRSLCPGPECPEHDGTCA